MSSNNSSTDSNVTFVALAVALAALIFTLGQLLGQYFATADGYRRCQPSVMGPWAKKTRLRWRWSQFRFETLFTTPEIFLWEPRLQNNHDREKMLGNYEWITGSQESKTRTLLPPVDKVGSGEELVCWLPFLRSLHELESALERRQCYVDSRSRYNIELLRPAIKFRERSWDFMSPDIIRPHAITSVSNIAILVRRLGMTWEDFRPHDGIMRAEGNCHIISSTFARSIGIILQYMRVGYFPTETTAQRASEQQLFIPSREADMMGFGILPGFPTLRVPSFKVGTIGEVYVTMDIMDPSHQASKKIRDIRGLEPKVTLGFSDLIPMGSGMLRARGSTVVRLPIPSEYCVGLTTHMEGFVVFHHRLMEYVAEKKGTASRQILRVWQVYESMKEHFLEWEYETLANENSNYRNIEFLDQAHDGWDEATAYFVKLEGNGLRYFDLMATHITHVVKYWGDAWENIREGGARDHYGGRDWVAEGAHMYWDYLPDMVTDMRKKGFTGSDELIHEAWITMMFRAFCRWRCHYMAPGEDMVDDHSRIPSRYWDSKMPVYIG